MAIEWLVLKDAFRAGTAFKSLCDLITEEQVIGALNVISDVNAEAAARLLREARDRSGDAQKQKLQAALPLLEAAYTARSKVLMSTRRRTVHRVRHPVAALEATADACRLAVLSAATYHALGNDVASVRSRIADAVTLCDRRVKQYERVKFWYITWAIAMLASGSRKKKEHLQVVDEISRRIDEAMTARAELEAVSASFEDG
ncbi:hypothetical protein [Streptomyces sp. BK340]|uniref:hypothetical protein n=1 Tax=Streptomyces sp. BK340 TaxID=2572903 RepID=UPI0011A8104B|nr:hypothetical protein [Streptomyces sp. BK340]